MRASAFAVAVAALLFAPPAWAQGRPCDQVTPFQHATPTGPVEIVPGIANQRIYFCGFSIAEKGPTLDLKIWSGGGVLCAIGSKDLSPQWSFPNDFALVNRIEHVGPFSNVGDSLCIQTFGSGALTGTIYWTQF